MLLQAIQNTFTVFLAPACQYKQHLFQWCLKYQRGNKHHSVLNPLVPCSGQALSEEFYMQYLSIRQCTFYSATGLTIHQKQIYTFASHHCILLALYFPFHIGQFYIITKLF